MARRVRLVFVLGCVAATCLAAAYGGAWWYGHAGLPTGIVTSYSASKLREAGFTDTELSVGRVTGMRIDLGPCALVRDGVRVSWDALTIENPLARYRSGELQMRLDGARIELEVPESSGASKPLTFADALSALGSAFDWKIGRAEIAGAVVTLLRNEKRQIWKIDVLAKLDVHQPLSPNSLALSLEARDGTSGGVEIDAILPADKGSVDSAFSSELRVRSPDLASITSVASFWGVDTSRLEPVTADEIRLHAKPRFDLEGVLVSAFDGTLQAVRYADQSVSVAGNSLSVRLVPGTSWRTGVPELELEIPELSASHSGWTARIGAVRLTQRGGDLQLQHDAAAAEGAQGKLRLASGTHSIPLQAATGPDPLGQLTLNFGQGWFEGSGAVHRWSAIAGKGVAGALPLHIDGLNSEWAEAGARLDFPLCRLAWEQASKRLTVEAAGWAERSTARADGAVELAEAPISLRSVIRLDGPQPAVAVLLEQPDINVRTTAGSSQLGWNGGVRLLGELAGGILHLNASAIGADLAVAVPDLSLSATTLALHASGVRVPSDRLEGTLRYFANSGLLVERPAGIDGCVVAAVDGLAAERAGEKVAERVRASAEARIAELDTDSGWVAEITNGRAAAGPVGLNRLAADLSGGLQAGRIAGSIHVRGTDIPLRFEQEFSWGDKPGARGTVTIDDAPISDLEPLLPLVPNLEGWEFGGRLGAQLQTEAGPEGVSADGTVQLARARAKAPDGLANVRELDGNFGVSLKGGNLKIDTLGELTANAVSSGTMELENLRGRVGLSDGRLRIEGVRAGGFGGQVFLKETEMDLGSGNLSTAVVLDNVALDLVLASFPDLPMQGQGRVFGEVPLHVEPSQFKIGTSVLRAGANGVIRLTVPELDIATGERPPWWKTVERAKWDVLHRAQVAMRTVDVRELTIEFDPPAEPGTGVLIRANGGFSNEEVKANVEVEARIRGELAEIFRLGMAVMGGFPDQKLPN